MATDIRALVSKEIAQLREAVAHAESTLASLKADLKTREGIYRLLSGGVPPKSPEPRRAKRADEKQKTAAKTAPARPAKTKPVTKAKRTKQKPFDWEEVLKTLPDPFTTDAAAETSAARGMSRRQAAMAVARWIKAGRIKKLMPGEYRKA